MPYEPKVEEYDIALAKYVADSAWDEIQFDYVRFPPKRRRPTFLLDRHPTGTART